MAKLGEINLHNYDKSIFEGGAFLLTTPSQISETVVLPNGNEVIVQKGNSYAIARIKNLSNSNPIFHAYPLVSR